MSDLPDLKGWEGKTIPSLHRATALIGALRLLTLERVPNYIEISTQIQAEGLSSGPLPFGEVLVNFQTGELVYTPPTGTTIAIPLNENSQATLLEKLLKAIEASGYILTSRTNPQMSLTDALLVALVARQHPFTPKREEIADETPLEVDLNLSWAYSEVLYRVFTAAARFRASLNGPQTPIVVWPEHFDLSFLWFPSLAASETDPQMNFGFAPYSPGLPRPYLYAYAYPMPEGFAQKPLPAGAFWNTEGWQGLVFPYDELTKAADFERAIEAAFRQVYEQLAPTLQAQPVS